MRKFLIAIILALASVTAHAQVSPKPEDIGMKLFIADTAKLSPNFNVSTQFIKPTVYDKWFKSIVECEGLKMPPKEAIDSLNFFAINAPYFVFDTADAIKYIAVTSTKLHQMVITLPHLYDYSLVGHEFLHYALFYNFGEKYEPDSIGKHDIHPIEYFGRCGILRH